MKQAVDYVEGGNFGVSPLVGQLRQQIWQSKNIADILFELTEFAAGIVDPGWQRGPAQLPAKGFVPFQTAPFVFDAATTVARLVAAYQRGKDDLTHPVRSFLVQGETHGQPKSPTRQQSRGPLISSWPSSSWTVDARAPAVERWRRRSRQRRP